MYEDALCAYSLFLRIFIHSVTLFFAKIVRYDTWQWHSCVGAVKVRFVLFDIDFCKYLFYNAGLCLIKSTVTQRKLMLTAI